MFKLLAVLCGVAFATTAAFGQPFTFTWTNQNPANTLAGDLSTAANWSPSPGNPVAVPNPNAGPDINGLYGDEVVWDGQTAGPLSITANTGQLGGSGPPVGLRFHLTANQTSPVQLFCPTNIGGSGISAGTRLQSILIDSGAGGLIIGDNSTNCLDFISGGVNGQIHNFVNNSATPAIINPAVRWRMGGGGAHPHVFDGTGDWIVNNRMRAQNGATIIVQKQGGGTMTWTATNSPAAGAGPDAVGNPITIGGGTLIMKSSDLVGGPAGNPNIVHNGTLLRYDAPVGSCLILGNISGTGPIQMNAGTLTLSGQSSISGNWTLSGGTLIAGSAEIPGLSGPFGQGGTISFNGSTLAYSANNAFDYSSRFSTAAGQAIRIDTAGQTVTFATDLTSSGGTLTKLGNGELVLAGTSTYSGLTTVSDTGTLTLQGPKTGSGNITVGDGATLNVVNSGTQVTPSTLTVGASSLEFENVTSTTTPLLAAGTLVSTGTILIGISSDGLSIGDSYPLLSWASGSAPAVSLGIVEGGAGTLSTNGNTIQFNCTAVALVWSGATDAIWNQTTVNWTQEGNPIDYSDPLQAVFNDTIAGGTTNVTLSGVVQPEAITINTTTNPYSITSSSGNIISGSVRFGKRGAGEASLAGGANTYTGITTLRGGTLLVGTLADGGSPSDIGSASSAGANLVFSGGALRYTGAAASMNRLFTVTSSGGTIANEGTGALTLNNPGAVSHSGALTLSGSTADTNTLAAGLVGGGSVTKSGTGTWILSGTNANSGGTVIASGVLQVGANGGTGSLGIGPVSIGGGTALDFLRTGSLTVPGVISGGGALSQSGSGTVVLSNNNNYSGGTTINEVTLKLVNGGIVSGVNSLPTSVNNSLLIFNTSGSFNYGGGANGIISGTGNVIVRGGGVIKATGNNSYAGWTFIDANTTFWPREGQDGTLLSSVVTNHGTLRIVSQNDTFIYAGNIVSNAAVANSAGRVQIGANNFNAGIMTLTGTNTYNGGTFIGCNQLVLGDGITPEAGSIRGNVQFVNNFTTSDDNPRTLTFNRPDNFTFSGTITTNFTSPQGNLGIVQQNGSGLVTLTGNNTYAGGTVVNGGGVQVGNGGGSGAIGRGPVTLNTQLTFDRTGTLAAGNVNGAGTLVKRGSGTVTLTGNSTAGVVVLEAGTLGAAPSGAIGSLTVAGDLTIVSGSTVLAGLDRSLSPSNSVFSALTITHTNGGSLRLINGGPALQVGDKFTIFNQPVPGGASMTIVSPGFSVQNDLAVDGSVTVTGVLPAPTITATVVNGTNLNLSWPSAWTGGVLVQGQTNSLAVGISNNWVTIPGTDAANTFSTVIRQTNQTVFFRLINP